MYLLEKLSEFLSFFFIYKDDYVNDELCEPYEKIVVVTTDNNATLYIEGDYIHLPMCTGFEIISEPGKINRIQFCLLSNDISIQHS